MQATTLRELTLTRTGQWRTVPAGTLVTVTAIIDGRCTVRLPDTYLTAVVPCEGTVTITEGTAS